MASDQFGLLVVDSATALFRTDFSGRGELSERQQKLNKFMASLMKIAEQFNVAIWITNQVMVRSSSRNPFRPPFMDSPLIPSPFLPLYLPANTEHLHDVSRHSPLPTVRPCSFKTPKNRLGGMLWHMQAPRGFRSEKGGLNSVFARFTTVQCYRVRTIPSLSKYLVTSIANLTIH